jgi:hypothetical protein
MELELTLRPNDAPHICVKAMSTAGIALRSRFRVLGRRDDFDHAIEHHIEVLRLLRADPNADLPRALEDLGNDLLKSLVERLFRDALGLQPPLYSLCY